VPVRSQDVQTFIQPRGSAHHAPTITAPS
jgi:hypothetical protein